MNSAMAKGIVEPEPLLGDDTLVDEPRRVYLVVPPSGILISDIDGIFSTRDRALSFIESEQKTKPGYKGKIEVWPVDAITPWRAARSGGQDS